MYGKGDIARRGVVICTLWSYPSILHALTVINESVAMSLEHMRTVFPLDRRNAELGLDAGGGNAGGEGLFVTKSKKGQRPPDEPHVYGWAVMMTALTTNAALSAEDKQKVAAYTSSASSPETLLQSIYWSRFKKSIISEGLGQLAVFRGLPDPAHLVPHHQSHEIEGCQREVRPGSSGGGNVREHHQMLDDL